jgi:Subtilisin inhibitor-like
MRSLLPLCALAMLLGACGGEDSSDAGTPQPETRLRITYREDADARTLLARLECEPAGGDHENAEEACRRLGELDDPFAPTPPDAVCTEIYGGPQTAIVTGTLRGDAVDAAFSRENGCEIERWDRHAFLFPGGS